MDYGGERKRERREWIVRRERSDRRQTDRERERERERERGEVQRDQSDATENICKREKGEKSEKR